MPFYHFGLLFVIVSLLTSCAQVGSLQGGEKDEEAPKLDSLVSSRPFTTDFKGNTVILAFNEWLVLDNPQQKVSISPPLKKKPTITLKGKRVVVTFDKEEQLLPNRTYRIQFGESIKDLNERNTVKDLEYVFSTGSEIHKGSYDVFVNDLQSGKPQEGIIVSLYEKSDDSLFRKSLPVYLEKTNKEGLARMKYLKPGQYYLYALEDKNQNNLFDLATEKIAFTDTSVSVSEKTGTSRLTISQTVQPLVLKNKTFEFDGLLKLIFNAPVDKQDYKILTKNSYFVVEEQDSVKVYYSPILNEPDSFIIDYGTKKDTLISKKLSPKKPPLLKLLTTELATNHKVNEPYRIAFNLPLASILTDSIAFIEDTVRKNRIFPDFKIDSNRPTLLYANYKWKDTTTYQLIIRNKAIKSRYEHETDSVFRHFFKTIPMQELGEYSITIDSLNSDYQYIIRFMNESGKELDKELISGRNQFKKTFSSLLLTTYVLEITEDRNFNRKWDAADYSKRQQPEFIFKKNLNPLKANWTTEQIIDFNKRIEPEKKDIKARGKTSE